MNKVKQQHLKKEKQKKVLKLTGYCGLYCGDCIRYKSKAIDLSGKLVAELEKVNFEKYAQIKSLECKELEYYKKMIKALKVIAKLQCSKPCRIGGGCPTFSCKVLNCCQKKGLDGCWECNKFDKCSKLDFLRPFHGDYPIKNLHKIKQLGLNKWVNKREKCYVWQKKLKAFLFK